MADEKLKRDAHWFKDYINSSDILMFVLNDKLRFITWSLEFQKTIGLLPSTLSVITFDQLFPEYYTSRCREAFNRALAIDKTQIVSFHCRIGKIESFFEWGIFPRKKSILVRLRDISHEHARIAEASLRAVFNSNLHSYMLLDRHGIVLDFNRAAYNFNVDTFGHVIKKYTSFFDIVRADDRVQFLAHFRDAIGGEIVHAEWYYNTPLNPRWFDIGFVPVYSDSGLITGVSFTCIDITDRKWAEEALRDSEERFRVIFEQAAVGIATVSVQGVILRVNSTFADIMDCTEEELVNASMLSMTLEEDRLLSYEYMQQAVERNQVSYTIELRFVKKNGKPVWTHVTNTLLRYANGDPRYFLCIIEDISLKKQTEEVLRKNEERFRFYLDNSPDGILLLDESGIVTFWNAALEDITGVSAYSMVGIHLWDYDFVSFIKGNNPENRLRFIAAELKMMLKNGSSSFLEELHEDEVHLEGHIIIVQWQMFPIQTAAGTMVGSMIRNITPLRGLAAEVLNADERFKSFYENTSVGIYTVTPQGKVLFSNPALWQLLGYKSFDAFAKINVARDGYFNTEDKQRFDELMRGTGAVVRFEALWKKADGSSVAVLESARAVKDSHGKILYYEGVVEDITERKQALEELQVSRQELRSLTAHLQAVREEERSSVAREIHDHLGQVLASLSMNLTALAREIKESDEPADSEFLGNELLAMASLTEQSIQQTKQLIASLRLPDLESLSFFESLETLTEDFRKKSGIPCTVSFPAEEPELSEQVRLAAYRICQEALTNVHRHSGAKAAHVAFSKEGDVYQLIIDDNGKGFTQTALQKPDSYGVIGMRERAILFGGFFKIENKENGTRVTLLIPVQGT